MAAESPIILLYLTNVQFGHAGKVNIEKCLLLHTFMYRHKELGDDNFIRATSERVNRGNQ